MSELPFLGVRPGMFEGAFRCPRCGFATTDANVFECPNCQLVWRERPKKLAPEAGQRVSLECSICHDALLPNDDVVFTGATGSLAHESCLEGDGITPPEIEAQIPDTYLAIVKDAEPVDGGEQYRSPDQDVARLEAEAERAWDQDFERRLKEPSPKKQKRKPCPCPPVFKDGRQVGKDHLIGCDRRRQ